MPADQGQATAFGLLAGICDRLFENVSACARNGHFGAFEGVFRGIAVQLLEQSTAGTEGDIVGRPASGFCRVKNLGEHFAVDAVSLDDPHFGMQKSEAFLVGFRAECLAESFQDFTDHLRRVSRVWPHHEDPVPGEDLVFECASPQGGAGREDVVRVADDRHEASRKLREHIPHRLHFVLASPGSLRRVFGGGDREARHFGAVVFSGDLQSGDRVGPLEIHQMRGSANPRGLDGRDAAETEIVQLEFHEFGIAGLFERRPDRAFHFAGLSGHGAAVPDLDEQRLQIIRQPIRMRIGILDRHEHVADWNDQTFRHCADSNWKSTTVSCCDVFPASSMKERGVPEEVRFKESLRLIDFFRSDDRPGKVSLQVVLKAEENGLVERPAAGFEVREHRLGGRRILAVMSDFVRVREEEEVVKVAHAENSGMGCGPLESVRMK